MLDGQGYAEFGKLKSRFELDGPAALWGYSSASFVDHWTITSAINPAGTPGTMQLGFHLSGMANILDVSANPVFDPQYAAVGLTVDKNPSSSSTGERFLDFSQDIGSGQLQIDPTTNGPTVTAPIDFIYGTPFGVSVALRTSGLSDNRYLFTTFSPHFEYYGGGSIDSIVVDFLNTAELTAIVIPGDAGARVYGESGVHYSGLVTTGLPAVPLPPAVWLFGSGLIGLLGVARHRRTV